MLVYVFSIQIQTAGQIWMKFGTEVVLKGTKGFFWVGGLTLYPHPPGTGCVKAIWGAPGASAMHFGENCLKQKLKGPLI